MPDLSLCPGAVSHRGPGQRSGAAETGEEGCHQVDHTVGEELLHEEERRMGGVNTQKCTCSDTYAHTVTSPRNGFAQ